MLLLFVVEIFRNGQLFREHSDDCGDFSHMLLIHLKAKSKEKHTQKKKPKPKQKTTTKKQQQQQKWGWGMGLIKYQHFFFFYHLVLCCPINKNKIWCVLTQSWLKFCTSNTFPVITQMHASSGVLLQRKVAFCILHAPHHDNKHRSKNLHGL